MTIKPTNKINKVPDDCANTYYDFLKNHEAELFVTKIPVLSGVSAADIISVFGAVVSGEASTAAGSVPAYLAGMVAAEIAVTITVALAADYLAVNTYAYENHDPTVYFDIGVSCGTQWWNFYDIGVYGEEGAFTGTANPYSSGTFIPVALAGGHNYSPESWQFFAEYDPHNSV